MIKLTLSPDLHAKHFTFHQSSVVIGHGPTHLVDLPISDDSLAAVHLKILEEDKEFFVINVANDPFVTLNDLPFGKKRLATGDLLHIGNVNIRVDEVVHRAIITPDVDEEVEEFDIREEPNIDVQAFSEEEVNELIEEKPNQQPLWDYLSPLLPFGVILFVAIAMLTAAIMYGKLVERNAEDRITAAEGVADVAMALAYAQINHIKPQHQNWSDPNFLKNNLVALLASEHPSFANIDSQGQFRNCPYLLRIYTTSDLSHFLVMAQPNPGLLHWMVPKAAIAIDSDKMEMRTLTDFKTLNRLLVSSNALTDSNFLEISHHVSQGMLLPLSALNAKNGFTPPKTLALWYPGAENLVYNSPRYHHFGDDVLNKALRLLQNISNSHEVTLLQQQLTMLSKFPNFVLYSTQGMQKALQSQEALATLMPNHKFLIAYLNFDAHGTLASGHLLLNSASKSIQPTYPSAPLNLKFQSQNENAVQEVAVLPSISPAIVDENGSDIHHPLLLQLRELAAERRVQLKPINEEMIDLLNGNTVSIMPDFSTKFVAILSRYQKADKDAQIKLSKKVEQLYHEYTDMPYEQFVSFLKHVGLENIIQKNGEIPKAKVVGAVSRAYQISFQLKKISETKNFQELDAAVARAAEGLNVAYVADPEALIHYQNELHSLTMHQLSLFMLSPASQLPLEAFCEENRMLLSRILKNAWITGPEEQSFYLNEFELLTERRQDEERNVEN